MADVSTAKRYLAIGVPFENAWLEKIAAANLNMRVVHTDHGIEKIAMAAHHHHDDVAHAYGLKQVPIEIEGKDPKLVQLKDLIENAMENGIKVVFVQPKFSTKSAEIVAREIGGQVAFVDPLAEDWMANLREAAQNFQAALK